MHRVSSKLLVFVIKKSIVRMFAVFTQPISIECVLRSKRNHPRAFIKSGYLIHLKPNDYILMDTPNEIIIMLIQSRVTFAISRVPPNTSKMLNMNHPIE